MRAGRRGEEERENGNLGGEGEREREGGREPVIRM